MVSTWDASIKMRRLARVSAALWIGSGVALLALAVIEDRSWEIAMCAVAVLLFGAERVTTARYYRMRERRLRAPTQDEARHAFGRVIDDMQARGHLVLPMQAQWRDPPRVATTLTGDTRDDSRFVESRPRRGGWVGAKR